MLRGLVLLEHFGKIIIDIGKLFHQNELLLCAKSRDIPKVKEIIVCQCSHLGVTTLPLCFSGGFEVATTTS